MLYKYTLLNMAEEPDRIKYLDGIRGWAAIMVFLSHYRGTIGDVDPVLRHQAFTFFTNGTMAVFIFWVLSAISLTWKYAKNPDKYFVLLSMFGRYFRLVLPIFVVQVLIYLLKICGAFYKSTQPDYTFWDLITFSFYYVIDPPNQDIYRIYENQPLWTIWVEFNGSILIFMWVAYLIPCSNQLIFHPIPMILLFISFSNEGYYKCFYFGFLSVFIYYFKFTQNKVFEHLMILPFIASIILASLEIKEIPHQYYAFFLVNSVMYNPYLKSFFSNRVSVFLGKISYPFYLMHWSILDSFGNFLVDTFRSAGLEGFGLSVLVLFFTLTLLFILSYLFYITIEVNSIKFSKRIATFLYDKHIILKDEEPEENKNQVENANDLKEPLYSDIEMSVE